MSFVALQCELFLAALFVSVQYGLFLAISGSIIFTVQYELFLGSYV